MSIEYPDYMIDLETTGVNPRYNNIIQIAGVNFNAQKRTINPETFDRCLMPMPNRFWDESTRLWWMKKPDVLQNIMNRMEPYERVLAAFRQWVGSEGEPVLWAKPSHFDFSFIQAYYNDMGQPPPFHYRYVNDMNSFARGRYYPEEPPPWERKLEFEGPAHDALFDCFHQLKVVFKLLDREPG